MSLHDPFDPSIVLLPEPFEDGIQERDIAPLKGLRPLILTATPNPAPLTNASLVLPTKVPPTITHASTLPPPLRKKSYSPRPELGDVMRNASFVCKVCRTLPSEDAECGCCEGKKNGKAKLADDEGKDFVEVETLCIDMANDADDEMDIDGIMKTKPISRQMA